MGGLDQKKIMYVSGGWTILDGQTWSPECVMGLVREMYNKIETVIGGMKIQQRLGNYYVNEDMDNTKILRDPWVQ